MEHSPNLLEPLGNKRMRLRRTSPFFALVAALSLFGCRFKSDVESNVLAEEDHQLLAETMIKRLDKSCGAGGCHESESGVLYSAQLIRFAQFTSPIHNCLVYNYCFDEEITAQGAKDCMNRCVVDRLVDAEDFSFGVYHATLREGGILNTLAAKAGMPEVLGELMKMPPQAPSTPTLDIAANTKRFKEIGDWMAAQAEDRAFRDIIAARGRPLSDWELPFTAIANRHDGQCGDTPQALLDLIDPDFRLDGVSMFGCSTAWPADPSTCLADLPDSPWRNADAKAVHVVTGATTEVSGHKVKLLRDISSRPSTAYWTRSSPDGRFMSMGNGIIEDLATGGTGAEGRKIDVNSASIDPAFDPTNRYYIWPGMICAITPLYDPAITAVGEDVEASKCREEYSIGTYGSIGAVDGDETVEVEGSNSNNSGWRRSDAGVYTGQNDLMLRTVNANDLTVGNRNRFQIEDEADFLLSPSGKVIVNRAVRDPSVDDPEQVYRIRMVRDQDGELGTNGDHFYITDNTKAATVCMKGEKPMTSFDNRFVAFHHHADGSPQDEGASDEHANIFVYDIKTGRYLRVTNMGNRSKAYFPHFRADGWLYFQVITYPDPGTPGAEITSEVYASNAALVLKGLPE